MTHLDQMIADALAQSPDTVVHQLASEVVRLRAEIADLKRGGVVVPELTELSEEPVVVEDFADNGAHSQWRLVDRSTGETLWEEATRTIPADRVLGEWEGKISREDAALAVEWCHAVQDLNPGYLEERDHTACKRFEALRAQPTQEPTT